MASICRAIVGDSSIARIWSSIVSPWEKENGCPSSTLRKEEFVHVAIELCENNCDTCTGSE